MRKLVRIFMTVVVVFLFLGCIETSDAKKTDDKKNDTIKKSKLRPEIPKEIGTPLDYLPMQIGTTWTYTIEVGEVKPIKYEEVEIKNGDKYYVQRSRKSFMPLLGKKPKKSYLLILKVLKKAEKQGKLEYPNSVELKVIKDELNYYDDAQQVFIAATSSFNFMAHEVITYKEEIISMYNSAWGGWDTSNEPNAFSAHIIFFGKPPQTEISLGENPQDKVLFVGQEPLPINKDIKALHFIRTVKPREKTEGETDSALNQGYEEHLWYVKGKGLYYRTQVINGKVSMTWTLTDFQKAK